MKKLLFSLLALLLITASLAAQEQNLRRFEDRIRSFEQQARESPPVSGGIVFAGSSTFALWQDMVDDFKPLPVINRGFGGSTFPELIYYSERIVIPCSPKIIVVYEGDNDISGSSSSAEKVLGDFRLFAGKIRKALPLTKIYYLSIKPSPARWEKWSTMREANRLIADYVRGRKNLGYIDITGAILGDNGLPRNELFLEDRLHLNREGYQRVTAIIKPLLEKELRDTR